MAYDAPANDDGFSLPTRLGRYRILAPLGSGGMAMVLLARAEGIGGFERDVAIKVIHPHLMDDEALVRQFLTEARIAARIRHPNVVPVLDVGRHAQGVHLVMEYVQGDSLSGLGRRAAREGGQLPGPIWMRILSDALLGLHAAHELTGEDGAPLGVVHRDFTPHNILVGTDGVARLCDFGVVKVVTSSDRTATGIVKGKLRYLAPEQVRARALDRRCDVWAAGVTAWEFLAGQPLYEQLDQVDLLLRIAIDQPPRLRSVNAEIAEALDEAVGSALTVNASARCPSAAAFRERLLAAWTSSQPVASVEEVADCVRTLCATRLEELQGKVERFERLRHEMGSLVEPLPSDPTPSGQSVPSTRAPRTQDPSEEVTLPELASATAATLTKPTRQARAAIAQRTHLPAEPLELLAPRRPSTRRTALWTGIAALGATAVGVGWTLSTPSSVPLARSDWTELDTSSWTATPPPEGSAAATPVVLEIVANLPIAAVRVDGVAVPLAAPSERVSIPLDQPAGTTVTVQVTSVDGRTASEKSIVQTGTLRIAFPRSAGVSPRKTAPPSPYE